MRDRLGYKTKVQVRDQNNNLELETHNITVLGGRIGSLESVFKPAGGVTPADHLTLDKNLLTQKDPTLGTSIITNPSSAILPDTLSAADLFARSISYFCIGSGGVNVEFPLAMADPRNYETRLYNMVPFRCVPQNADLSLADRQIYAMRRLENINGAWYYSYYLKQFNPGLLNLVQSDGTDYTPTFQASNAVVPSSSGNSSSPTDTAVHSYFEFNLDIDAVEFKEFYKLTNNNTLTNARITEFGLVLANKHFFNASDNSVAQAASLATPPTTYTELNNIELFSKVVHSPTYMDQEENAKRITYTIFS